MTRPRLTVTGPIPPYYHLDHVILVAPAESPPQDNVDGSPNPSPTLTGAKKTLAGGT